MNRRIKTTAAIRTMPPPAAPAIKPMGRPFSSVFSVLENGLFSPVEVVIETDGLFSPVEVVIETDGLFSPVEVDIELDGLVFEPEFEVFELDEFVGSGVVIFGSGVVVFAGN